MHYAGIYCNVNIYGLTSLWTHVFICALNISLSMLAVMHVVFAVSVYGADSCRSSRPR
jgi:hypothetical protein